MEAFFKRALTWEKGEEDGHDRGVVLLSQEKDGVYLYEKGQEKGALLEGNPTKLPMQQIRKIAPGFKGFNLAMTYLNKVS